MWYLKREVATQAASVYKLHEDYARELHRYIVSTPETRQICNCPETLGCQYTDLMRRAMVATLKSLPFMTKILDNGEDNICTLNFLRGGLNFDLRGALHLAYGFNRHRTSFMTSQRSREQGRWTVREDAYRKFNFPGEAVILIGDVVATGVTVDNGLSILVEHLQKQKCHIKNLIFFTIGCHKLEKMLQKYDAIFRSISPIYEGSYVVYLEGKFKLVDSKTPLRIGVPGTDLVRFDCITSPEFELSQYQQICYPLERCTIYDSGTRAFDVPDYINEVCGYWQKVRKLAIDGMTLYEALKERWPENDYHQYEILLANKQQHWHGVDENFCRQLHQAYQSRWCDDFCRYSRTSDALLEICEQRLQLLKSLSPSFRT